MEKKVKLTNFNNLGLYVFANDKLVLTGNNLDEREKKLLEEVFDVPIYQISILNTNLIGIFLTGNNNVIIAPESYNDEKLKLQKICDENQINLIFSDDNLNTFGNNLCIKENIVLSANKYSKRFVELLKKNDLDFKRIKLDESFSIGSLSLNLNNKLLISQNLSDEEIEEFEKFVKIDALGSIAQGSSYLKSNIVGNSNSLILFEDSSTVEIQNVIESLDFL